MKVFISWSGPKSKEMSIILERWMSLIFPHIQFFISDEIEKGSNFLEIILKELNEASLGIFLLTKGNTSSQWIQFEAGAFASKGDDSKIFPIWLDPDIDISDTGPLRFYQGCFVNQKDIKLLIKSINNSLPDPIAEETLIRLYDSNKEELFFNWQLIENIPSGEIDKLITNRDILNSIFAHVQRIYDDTKSLNKNSRQVGGFRKIDNIKPCTFSDHVTKVEGMGHYCGRLPRGGHFTSNEAWSIAIGEQQFEYKPLTK
ncbi:MAG: toll/interleukin-1 receptor domain-containing protein [Neptuniibacter sp.]